jgi:hypothetical protein
MPAGAWKAQMTIRHHGSLPLGIAALVAVAACGSTTNTPSASVSAAATTNSAPASGSAAASPTASPTTDLTSGWVSYTSKDGTFTFKHPANLQVSDCLLQPAAGVSGSGPDDIIVLLASAPPDCSTYQQQGGGPPAFVSFDSHTYALPAYDYGAMYSNDVQTAVTVDGMTGTRNAFDYLPQSSTRSGIDYRFVRPGWSWWFSDGYGNLATGMSPDVFDAMIKTVTFRT